MSRSSFKVLIPLLVATVLLQVAVPAFGTGPSYNPGVLPGQWAKYGQITALLIPNPSPVPIPSVVSDLLSVNSTTITTQSVLGHNVTAERLRTYPNGTKVSDTLLGNLESGAGNLTYWILAGDLTAGDRFWNETATPVYNFAVNDTVGRIYLGVTRSVNALNVTLVGQAYGGTYQVKVRSFWDQMSGVLLEFHLTFDYFVATIRVVYGSVNAMIVDSNIFGASVRPDFFLYASPIPIVAAAGARGIAYVFPVSLDDFTGNVSLSAVFLGSDQATTAIIPASVQVSPSGSERATLTVTIGSTVSPREYGVNLTGTSSNGLSHSIIVPVQVFGSRSADFMITSDGATFQAGSSGTAIIHLASLNGFSGNVTIHFDYVFCAAIGCPKANLSHQIVYLSPGGTASSELTFSTSMPGIEDFVLNATGGSLTHTVTVEFNVNPPYQPDFGITAVPEELTIQAGKSGTATITVSPGCCFTEIVNFTTTSPSGITVQLSQNSVAGARTISLTVSVAGNLAPGSYTVTIKAAGGSQTHAKTISVNVTAPSSQPSATSSLILGMDPTVFYTIIGGLATVIIVGGVLAMRVRKPPSSERQSPTSIVANNG